MLDEKRTDIHDLTTEWPLIDAATRARELRERIEQLHAERTAVENPRAAEIDRLLETLSADLEALRRQVRGTAAESLPKSLTLDTHAREGA